MEPNNKDSKTTTGSIRERKEVICVGAYPMWIFRLSNKMNNAILIFMREFLHELGYDVEISATDPLLLGDKYEVELRIKIKEVKK